MNKVRWTPEEDKILLETISSNFTNLTKAFELVQIKLPNRTYNSINIRWYRISKLSINKCYVSIGRDSTLSNRKVVKDGTSIESVKSTESKFKKILRILFKL